MILRAPWSKSARMYSGTSVKTEKLKVFLNWKKYYFWGNKFEVRYHGIVILWTIPVWSNTVINNFKNIIKVLSAKFVSLPAMDQLFGMVRSFLQRNPETVRRLDTRGPLDINVKMPRAKMNIVVTDRHGKQAYIKALISQVLRG